MAEPIETVAIIENLPPVPKAKPVIAVKVAKAAPTPEPAPAPAPAPSEEKIAVTQMPAAKIPAAPKKAITPVAVQTPRAPDPVPVAAPAAKAASGLAPYDESKNSERAP